MYGKTLFAIFALLGLSQSDVADAMSTSRVNVHRWASGKRQVPEQYWAPLMQLVEMGIARREAAYAAGSITKKAFRTLDKIPALLYQLAEDNKPTPGIAFASCIEKTLDALEPFREMTPSDLRDPAYISEFVELTDALHRYGKLLQMFGPLLDLVMLAPQDLDAYFAQRYGIHAAAHATPPPNPRTQEETPRARNHAPSNQPGPARTTKPKHLKKNAGPLVCNQS